MANTFTNTILKLQNQFESLYIIIMLHNAGMQINVRKSVQTEEREHTYSIRSYKATLVEHGDNTGGGDGQVKQRTLGGVHGYRGRQGASVAG